MISEGLCDTGVMMLKIPLCFTGIKYMLKYIKIENFKLNSYFKKCMIFFSMFDKIDSLNEPWLL